MPAGINYSKFDNLDCSDSEDEETKKKPAEDGGDANILADIPYDLPPDLSLVLAARHGQPNVVEALLDRRASANAADPHGKTALHSAVEGGVSNRPAIELLLKRGARVDLGNNCGDSPLDAAAATGPVELMQALIQQGTPNQTACGRALVAAAVAGNAETSGLLLDAGAELVHRSSDDRSALHCWAKRGNAAMSKRLMLAGADSAARDKDGYTPLLCAVQSGSVDCMCLLVESKADITAVSNRGDSVLVFGAGIADATASAEMVKALLPLGSSLEADPSAKGASSPLVAAASNGRVAVAQLLLDAGAAAGSTDGQGRRPLPCATAVGSLELCRLLLEGRADINARGTAGSSGGTSAAPGEEQGPSVAGVPALAIAVGTQNAGLTQVLLDANADPDLLDERGQTPIMVAARLGSAEICRALIAARTNVDARQESSGKTALLLAAAAGHSDVCSGLVVAKADLTLASSGGAAPLHAAASGGHSEICTRLLAAGASPTAPGPGGKPANVLAFEAGHQDLSKMLAAAKADALAKAEA